MKPLNPIAEEIAKKIAAVLPDKKLANHLFSEFNKSNPNLKKWESFAIGDRAMFLYQNQNNQISTATTQII